MFKQQAKLIVKVDENVKLLPIPSKFDLFCDYWYKFDKDSTHGM